MQPALETYLSRAYWRDLATAFPKAALASCKDLGAPGLYLATCVFVLRRLPWPLQPHPLIRLTNWNEATNYLDNFILGELRLDEPEQLLAQSEGEVIEVGVNVGITTRWWLTLNPALSVIGVDMMREALDFTTRRVSELGHQARWQGVEGAVGDAEGRMTIHFDDPLEGTNSVDHVGGSQQREVEVNTLDAYLSRATMNHPILMKVDIEGHAAAALRGASSVLQRLRWVVVETHDPEELAQSAALLTDAGFLLRHFHGRTMWWKKREVPS
ncbi:MAG: FkbM family methyltransferase [Prosthecobacter sp.]